MSAQRPMGTAHTAGDLMDANSTVNADFPEAWDGDLGSVMTTASGKSLLMTETLNRPAQA